MRFCMSSSRIGGLVVVVQLNELHVCPIEHHVIFSCGVISSHKSMKQGVAKACLDN